MVKDPEGRAKKPDLVLVDDAREEWYVIEVGLASHSIDGHIRPQLEVLRHANYHAAIVDTGTMDPPLNELERTRLQQRLPSFLLIANEDREALRLVARELDYEYLAIERLQIRAEQRVRYTDSLVSIDLRRAPILGLWPLKRTSSRYGRRGCLSAHRISGG